MASKKNGSKARHVVVTTAHRGVFVGRLESESADGKSATLLGARMIVYWDAKVRGVLGLATTGVTAGCRVTSAVDKIALRDVTAIIDATPAAAATWESQPWA